MAKEKDETTQAPKPADGAAAGDNAPKNVQKPEDSKVIGNWPETLPGHPPKPPSAPGR